MNSSFTNRGLVYDQTPEELGPQSEWGSGANDRIANIPHTLAETITTCQDSPEPNEEDDTGASNSDGVISTPGKKKLERISGRAVEEPFQINVIDVTNSTSSNGFQTLRLELPRVSSFGGSFSSEDSSYPPRPFLIHSSFLPETSRSASLSILPGDSSRGVPSSDGVSFGTPLPPPHRSSSSSSLLPQHLPHRSASSISLSNSAFLSNVGGNEDLMCGRTRRHSASPLPGKALKVSSRSGLPSPSRRLSDIQTLTSSLGLHIHESLLSLANSYGKSWKQSDQMVSLSFKSLESFVNEDNVAGLRSFLESRSVVIDDRDDNGASVLIHCAARGKAQFCKELLSHGADVNAEDNDSWTALITAAKEGHHEVVSVLLEYDAAIDQRDFGGWTSFMWACYKGHVETAKILMEYGADPNAQGQHNMSPLVWAAGRGHLDIVTLLLLKGAKVNLGDRFGTTPLIWACRKGYLEIAEELLSHGASVDATGMYSWTPLLVASKGNYVDLVNLLLEHKPNVNALDKDGGTALTIACKEGFSELAASLLRAGAYVNIQDRNGDSNLIYAARAGHRTVVESLLKKHADIDCVGKDKKTALYWAVEKGHTSIVKLLLSANVDLEHSTKEGDTALLRSVRTKNAEIVEMLVDKKARVSVADKKGDTALHIAMRGRSKRIVEILLRNPKNSQMLYRPNRAGETPYNIDLSHQKTILGQIFGARRLNTNEENENMLGYDLYSSSLADILSEPSLTMPISLGLYARWGSGKSFLIRKLREEMNSFARQWVEPLFQFTFLAFFLVLITSFLIGFVALMSSGTWYWGFGTAASVFLLSTLFLVSVWYGSRSKYDLDLWYKWSVALAAQIAAFKLVAQVIFCSPPGIHWKEGVQAKPLKFIFAEGAKPSSTGAGGNSITHIMGSLFNMIENQYGIFATRFYRAFRPKPFNTSSPWKYRRLCGIPYIVIFFTTLGCGLALTYLAATYGFHQMPQSEEAASIRTIQKRWAPDASFTEVHDWKKSLLVKRNVRMEEIDDEEDDEDDDDDMDDEGIDEIDDDNGNSWFGNKNKSAEEDEYGRPFHGRLINPLLFILSGLVALVVVANIHTLARMTKALIFSHRRHLLSAISKFDTMSSEGYIPTLKEEVNLMIDMVRCLDGFTSQQTRLVVILDGLDSCEQEKVLSVLDAVHALFTDSSGPFIIFLAIDPHIITKAIELNATKVFRESSFSGHDYLRNIIHLPFYLQNAGLRKVKLAEQAAEHLKGRSQLTWSEQETEVVTRAMTSAMGGLHHIPISRHMSSASELGYSMQDNRRMSTESGMSIGMTRRTQSSRGRRLRPSDSVGSSIASNLHHVSAASDLNKVLLTDDYFNDINPRSMRRLMNVVYITGRLLKAFHIEFNWYHLALWVNITEQWPYRASWLIHSYEKREDTYDEKSSLKDLYEKIKTHIPVSKEMEPLLEMDKDERKLETFLAMHENVLHVYNLVIFLPFTINLDPYIKKKIKEDQIQMDDAFPRINSPPPPPPLWSQTQPQRFDSSASRSSTLSWGAKMGPATLNPLMWGFSQPPPAFPQHSYNQSALSFSAPQPIPSSNPNLSILPVEAHDKNLSALSIDAIFELLGKVEGVSLAMLPSYKATFLENNINGKVLLHCGIEDLKQIAKMTFGDWELFKMLILGLRDLELNHDDRNFCFPSNQKTESLSHQPSESISEQSDVSIHSEGTSILKRGSLRGSFSNKDRDDCGGVVPRKNPKTALHSKQVTLEEQMIFGALQTLNEEAFEDVLEEQAKQEVRNSCFNQELLDENEGSVRKRSRGSFSIEQEPEEEIEVVYLQNSPLLPHTIVSCPPESDSTAQSLTSSFSPYRGSVSLSRASSVREGSLSASPKHNVTMGLSNEGREPSSKCRPSSPSHESQKVEHIGRPSSLMLSHGKTMDDSDANSENHFSADSLSIQCIDKELQTSLPDICATQNGPRNVLITEHISNGSYSSLERLRRLTKRLQRSFSSQESGGSAEVDGHDPESSPLVGLRSPPGSQWDSSPPVRGMWNKTLNGIDSASRTPPEDSSTNLSSTSKPHHLITVSRADPETPV